MSDAGEEMYLEAETDFGLNILRTQALNDSLVFSPLSIALALSLLHAGAGGNSRSQIASAIAKGANDDQLAQHYASLSESLLKSKEGVQALVANRVFANKGFKIKQSYLDTVKKQYNAGAEVLDFDQADPSAAKMNKFVEDNTGGKIKELIKPDALKNAVAFIINALYFKGDWADQFYATQTHNLDFHSCEKTKRSVPFLSESEVNRNYASDDVFEVLSLNYKDSSYSFAVFLPKQRFGLEKAVKSLDAKRFQKLLSSLSSTYININIPKMKVEKEIDLKPVLEKLGITEVFTDSADLSGIADDIKVSDGKHKALIEVDEKGTTASASTLIKMVRKCARTTKPLTFFADHPFFFALLKKKHPVFLGVYQ